MSQQVKEAQAWLNKIYSGRSTFKPIKVDGQAGSVCFYAFVVALKIEVYTNPADIPNINGYFKQEVLYHFNTVNSGAKDSGGKHLVELIQYAHRWRKS